MVKYLKKPHLFTCIILLSAIIAIILFRYGVGEGIFVISSTTTPRDPLDPFYDIQSSKVIEQYLKWKEEFGNDKAIQMTVDWLNGVINVIL